jgi:hypothetical protein
MTEEVFAALRPIFQPLVERLTAMPSAAGPGKLPERRGVYLLSEGAVHLYVGIAGNLRRRWNDHRYGQESGATLAIKLARERTRKRLPRSRRREQHIGRPLTSLNLRHKQA